MVFKNLCVLVLWTKVASALKGLIGEKLLHLHFKCLHKLPITFAFWALLRVWRMWVVPLRVVAVLGGRQLWEKGEGVRKGVKGGGSALQFVGTHLLQQLGGRRGRRGEGFEMPPQIWRTDRRTDRQTERWRAGQKPWGCRRTGSGEFWSGLWRWQRLVWFLTGGMPPGGRVQHPHTLWN